MSIVLNLQNLTHIFWTIIIALNLYVLLLLYRVSKLYRVERINKLQATACLKEQIEYMRIQYLQKTPRPAPPQQPESAPGDVANRLQTRQENRANDPVSQVPPLQLNTMSSVKRNSMRQKASITTPAAPTNKSAKPPATKTTTIKSPTTMRSISSSSSMPSNRSDDSRNNPHSDEQHTLYISDSFGRVVHEIPFKEGDYLDALCAVLGDQHWKAEKKSE